MGEGCVKCAKPSCQGTSEKSSFIHKFFCFTFAPEHGQFVGVQPGIGGQPRTQH